MNFIFAQSISLRLSEEIYVSQHLQWDYGSSTGPDVSLQICKVPQILTLIAVTFGGLDEGQVMWFLGPEGATLADPR